MPDLESNYNELISRYKEVAVIGSVNGLLQWDMQTIMPPKGSERRSDQLALLAGIAHNRMTSPRIDELLTALEAHSGELPPEEQANIREIRRDQKKAVKVPQDVVEELSRHE
ncbi:carboxypeptidase M32, partial [candidate division KSB1 bacterium]